MRRHIKTAIWAFSQAFAALALTLIIFGITGRGIHCVRGHKVLVPGSADTSVQERAGADVARKRTDVVIEAEHSGCGPSVPFNGDSTAVIQSAETVTPK